MIQRKEHILMTIRDFVYKTKAPRGQSDKEGLVIQQHRVLMLSKKENFIKLLCASQSPIVLTVDYERLQGNHRHAATKLLLENGELDPNFQIEVTRYLDKLTSREEDEIIFHGNNGHSTVNNGIMATNGDFDLTNKAIGPIYNVIENLKLDKKVIPKKRQMQFARLLAGYFNSNPLEVEGIKLNNDLSVITGAEIYRGRSTPAGKNTFTEAKSNVNLRDKDFKEYLGQMLKQAFDIIVELKFTGDWKRGLGNNSTFEYIIIAAALRGEISSFEREAYKLTKKKFITSFKNYNIMRKLKEGTIKFTNFDRASEDKILDLFR